VRIGEAAQLIGVPTHVLRHWEHVGAVVPRRHANGHRVYDEDAITSARLLRLCQHAGMSLAEIVDLSRSSGERRAELVAEHRDAVEAKLAELHATRDFLEHVLKCRHTALGTCAKCATYAKHVV